MKNSPLRLRVSILSLAFFPTASHAQNSSAKAEVILSDGKHSDLAILQISGIAVAATYINGKQMYSQEGVK